MKVSFTGVVIIQAVSFGLITDRDFFLEQLDWLCYVLFSSSSFLSVLTQWLIKKSYDHLEYYICINTFITI